MSSNDPAPPLPPVAAPEASTSRPPTPAPVQSTDPVPEAPRDRLGETHTTTETPSASARTSFTRVDAGGMEERANELLAVRSLQPSNEAPVAVVESPEPPSPLGTVQESDPAPDPKLTHEIAPASASALAPMSEPVPEPAPEPVPEPVPELVVPQTPQTSLTFLLVSGRRRTMSFDPDTTVGRVKELVWNAWPSEWQDDRPPAPSYLRILYLGKILQDDDTLTKLNFSSHIPSPSAPHNTPPPTIVHLSIRSHAPPADDGALKKKSRRRRRDGPNGSVGADGEPGEDGGGAGCCGCVVC